MYNDFAKENSLHLSKTFPLKKYWLQKTLLKIKWLQICICMCLHTHWWDAHICFHLVRLTTTIPAFIFPHQIVECTLWDYCCVRAGGRERNTASCRGEGSPSLDSFIDKMAIIGNITVWNDSVILWNLLRSNKISHVEHFPIA